MLSWAGREVYWGFQGKPWDWQLRSFKCQGVWSKYLGQRSPFAHPFPYNSVNSVVRGPFCPVHAGIPIAKFFHLHTYKYELLLRLVLFILFS